jgi:hypothetical protein
MPTGTLSILLALSLLIIFTVPPAHSQTPGTPQVTAKAPPPTVKIGEAAPDFTLPYLAAGADPARPDRKQITLSSFKGRQPVVVAFFPAAFSPG